jgi:hypothetical protein
MDEACSACPNDRREEHMNTIVHSAQATASQKRRARIAGVLYLIVAAFAAFAFNYATGRTYVPGNAAATAQSVLANAGLVRAGVVADLIQATAWIFTAMAFYLLLRHVNENRARAMVILVAVGATIVCVRQVFPLAALLVVTENGYAAAFGAAGSNALALLLLDIRHYGSLVAEIFMGLWLVPLGYLVYKSGLFPRALGVALVVGSAGWIAGSLAGLLDPASGEAFNRSAMMLPTIAEVWLLGYLLVKGVRSPSAPDRRPVAVPGRVAIAG